MNFLFEGEFFLVSRFDNNGDPRGLFLTEGVVYVPLIHWIVVRKATWEGGGDGQSHCIIKKNISFILVSVVTCLWATSMADSQSW